MGFFDKIKQGLTKTKTKMDAQLTGIFAAYEPGDEEFFEDLEETLILADTGLETTTKAIAQLRKAIELKKLRTMHRDAIVFACANPTPEIFPDEAKAAGAAVVSTGRSDYPNQINNVLAFPGIFRGAFDVRASDINEPMKLAAAHALSALITSEELCADYIIPKAFDPRVGPAVAAAVAQAARESGVARI